jgi:hypothetical protein
VVGVLIWATAPRAAGLVDAGARRPRQGRCRRVVGTAPTMALPVSWANQFYRLTARPLTSHTGVP